MRRNVAEGKEPPLHLLFHQQQQYIVKRTWLSVINHKHEVAGIPWIVVVFIGTNQSCNAPSNRFSFSLSKVPTPHNAASRNPIRACTAMIKVDTIEQHNSYRHLHLCSLYMALSCKVFGVHQVGIAKLLGILRKTENCVNVCTRAFLPLVRRKRFDENSAEL